MILGVRQYLREHGANGSEPIVGKYVPEKMLWQCTSCGACEYQCPVGIEHLPIIIGLRRGAGEHRQVGRRPWRQAIQQSGTERKCAREWRPSERDKFIQKNAIPVYDGSQEYCLWLGCMGSYDPRGREIILSLIEVFRYLGVTYGVLKKEKCTGDPVRRLGNDYLFTELAENNLEQIKSRARSRR